MSRARKKVTMTLTVSVPRDMTEAMARKEVRTLITWQANWFADPDDVKVVKCVPAKAKGGGE